MIQGTLQSANIDAIYSKQDDTQIAGQNNEKNDIVFLLLIKIIPKIISKKMR